MRITLIQPAQPGTFLGANFTFRLPPLGVMQVAGCTPEGHDVVIRDESLEQLDFDEPTDLVGISVMTPAAPRAYEIAREFRARGIRVVLGGVHTAMQPDEAALHADSLVLGEAEVAWPRLVEDAAEGRLQPLYRGEKNRPLGTEHPRPRRDLIEGKGYAPVHFVETTRGCSHACEFCSVTSYWGGRYRSRSIEDVVDELRGLRPLTGSRFSLKNVVFFVDDNIASSREYAAELFAAIRPLGLTWLGQASLEMGEDPELLRMAAESGCRGLLVGFESVTSANREFCRKLASVERYRRAIRNIHAAGIGIEGSFIVGFDHDDENTFSSIYSFAIETRLDSVYLGVLTPYPGTVLYRKMKREGRLLDRDWSAYNTSETVFRPHHMSAEDLERRYIALYRRILSGWSIARRCLGMNGRRFQFFLPMNLGFQRTIARGSRLRAARPSSPLRPEVSSGNGTPAKEAPELLALIPAFNEAASIETVVADAQRHVGEVLVVDDGSTDATARLAGDAGATVIRHTANLGKATALQTGFDYAIRRGCRAVVLLDGDGQHDAAEIPALVTVWRERGVHLVAGNRMTNKVAMPTSRRAVNALTAWIAHRVSGRELPDCHCGFRLVDTDVLRTVRLQSKRFAGDSELLVWAALHSFSIEFVPVRCFYRGEKSNIRPIGDGFRLLGLAVRALAERARLRWGG